MGRLDASGGIYETSSTTERKSAFQSGEYPVAVYGLGKMGLPLAAVYGEVTGNVIGVDVDTSVIQAVNDGHSPIQREPGLSELVEALVSQGQLKATTDYERATREATIHIVIVPTPIDDNRLPDLSILRETVRRIGGGLTPGDIVVIECTVPPRTCVDVVEPLLVEESHLDSDEFGVAYCPERTASGRALRDIRRSYPKVVGGIDEHSTEVAKDIYECITDNNVLACSNTVVTECVKLFEGLYRDVNIALVNELARFVDEIDVNANEAIEIANTAPYVDLHTPGAGVGGHCIPYYPYFLINMFETDAPLLRTARGVNDSMPDFTVEKVREGFREVGRDLSESTVLVLGVTFRPDVAETRAAPAKRIIKRLSSAGAEVLAVDPLLPSTGSIPAELISLEDAYQRTVEGVVVVTPHSDFEEINWDALRGHRDRLVIVDGRQAYDLSSHPDWAYTIGTGLEPKH